MFRKTLVAFAVFVPILATGAGVALSQREKEAKRPADLTGEWLLDASRSDMGPGRGGPGGWMGRGGSRRGGGAGRGRMARLPERIRVEQGTGTVSIADSAGAPLETITIGASGESSAPEGGVARFSGAWKDGRLQVVRQGPRGRVTQTFSLEEHGQRLVIQMKMESEGPRPSREFKRVYRRVST
jgi:hypothetical protein